MSGTPPGKKLMQNPIDWLFRSSLMVLGAAIALQLAVCILAGIWQWVLGIILTAAVALITFRVLAAKRRRW